MALEGEQLGFLEKTVKLIEKYGLFRIFKALCVIALFIYIMTNGATFIGGIVERVTRETIKDESIEKVRQHDIALKKRQFIKPQIDSLLRVTLYDSNADRAFIMEMHNGTNNVSGLPFLYGEMTYENVSEGIAHIEDDYTNINLSRFSFPTYLEKEHIWIGSIEELSKIDSKLTQRLTSNDVTYLAIAHIHGIKNELGFFGITYCNGKVPKSEHEILQIMLKKTQILSTLLDSAILMDKDDEKDS